MQRKCIHAYENIALHTYYLLFFAVAVTVLCHFLILDKFYISSR